MRYISARQVMPDMKITRKEFIFAENILDKEPENTIRTKNPVPLIIIMDRKEYVKNETSISLKDNLSR